MKIIVVGAGNVATHLAQALATSGEQIAEVWSNQPNNAEVLAATVRAKAITKLHDLDHTADLCLVAVKDDAITAVAEQLRGFKGIIAHTSGSVPMSVFDGFQHYGVFYPLQTFSKTKGLDLSNVPLCLEANSPATMSTLEALAGKLTGNVKSISSEERKILHLSAVFACNFTNHLYALSNELLDANGLAFDFIRPLIVETALKVQHALPLDVQTGPAIRNDIETEKRHLQLLEGQKELKNIYKTLSESIKKSRT